MFANSVLGRNWGTYGSEKMKIDHIVEYRTYINNHVCVDCRYNIKKIFHIM